MKRGKVFLSFSTMPLIGEILLVVCVMTKMASYLNNTCWSHTVLLRCLGTAPRTFIYRLRHRTAATWAFQVVVIGIRMMIGIRTRIIEISFTHRFVKSKREEVSRFE